jgi:hypothetical protein
LCSFRVNLDYVTERVAGLDRPTKKALTATRNGLTLF